MVSLVFVHASDGNNALLAKEVETRAVEMGHEVNMFRSTLSISPFTPWLANNQHRFLKALMN